MRFHDSSTGEGGLSAFAAGSADRKQLGEIDDAPGARSKLALGLIPKAKVSATHDSRTKAARFIQECPETYWRRLTMCVEPENMEDAYEELPSPLPSPDPL